MPATGTTRLTQSVGETLHIWIFQGHIIAESEATLLLGRTSHRHPVGDKTSLGPLTMNSRPIQVL